jgi:hypothetical protein
MEDLTSVTVSENLKRNYGGLLAKEVRRLKKLLSKLSKQ